KQGGGAAEADHRIFLVRLVALAADQVRVFIRLEIGQAYDDRIRRERRGDRRDDLGQAIDVELDRVFAADALVDQLLRLGILFRVFEQRLRMQADVAGADPLTQRQGDTRVTPH